MPPVLNSTNYDYDYDVVQPYFFLNGEEEDFYPPPRSQLLPAPSEDIWKKFELLPTPPLSPSRRPSLSAADHLEAVSDLLDDDHSSSAAFLQSFIIQDCMWSSSFAAATELEKVVSERLASLRARRDSCNTKTITDRTANEQVGGSQVSAGYLQDFHTSVTDCIDPSVVFLGEKQMDDGVAMEVGSELRLDSPPPSSSDSESEEEDDDDDEEEEEIDVVTVDKRKSSQRSHTSPLVLKRSHVNIHQHNYAAQQPPEKRVKAESSSVAPRQSGGRRCWSPKSEGEDNDKRRTHNVLERQRRNELKMSFMVLRDEVPAVANNEKAAKVVILKKATEFIMEVREQERKLLAKKDELRKRSRELKQRLQQLRTSH